MRKHNFMENFRTIVSPDASKHKMGISDRIFSTGSCFATAIGNRLLSNKLAVISNPFGVLYSPDAIHKTLHYAIFNEMPPPHTFVQHQDVFLNYDFHSEISSLQEFKLHSQLKEIIGSAHYFLGNTQWLIITYGTSWVYERKDTGEIVANCHKIPQKHFSKSLLSEQQIKDSFKSFYKELKEFNRNIKIVLTLSPVRHLKDTLELNSVSKSILRTACFSIAEEFDDVNYFPAYEIMMDELRDYRFYASDMIHPTVEAEEYIFEKFMESYGSASLKDLMHQWKDIQNALLHKPFHPTSQAHQAFLRITLRKLEELKTTLNVDEEITAVKSQLLTE